MHAGTDQPADGCTEEQQEQQPAPEVVADVGDGEEPEGENSRFERGGKNGAHRARDNADNDVAHTHKHLVFFVEDHDVASDILPSLDRDGFAAAAAALAATLRPGDVVALSGGLGAGKTTFVRAIVAALHGSDAAVSSPTFVFRQTYPGTPPIEHLDVYRVDDPAEAADLGLEDAFAPDTVTVVEWPERVPGLVPPGAIRIAIEGSGERPRHVRIER
jgi:tRNA threonylcarbamoyladenosine biosynthesis protein TsaE